MLRSEPSIHTEGSGSEVATESFNCIIGKNITKIILFKLLIVD